MQDQALLTLPRALERAAGRTGYGFTFVKDDLSEEDHPWSSLLEEAKSLAVALAAHGMKKGDHVALILPEAGDFVPTDLGGRARCSEMTDAILRAMA